MHDEIATGLGQGPQREYRLVSRLGVHGVGGVNVGCPVRNAVFAAQLPAHQNRFHVLRGSKRRRPRFHVHIRSKAAIHHRGSGANQLGKCNACQCFGILLCERASNRHRGHGACQGEGRQNNNLVAG